MSEHRFEDGAGAGCEGCEGCAIEGIRWPAEPDCRLPEVEGSGWEFVERCDACERYPDDLTAASKVFAIVRLVPCADGGWHAVGREKLL